MIAGLAHHGRLLISTVAAVVGYLVLPREWTQLTRLLASWNLGVLLFLGLIYRFTVGMDATQIAERYEDEDEAAAVILIIGIVSAILTMVAIVAFLARADDVGLSQRGLDVALAALTVVDTWMLVPTMFMLHYADMFYSASAEARPLRFPDTSAPVFRDFAYFSFTIAAACQTADVSTAQGSIRAVVLAHSVLSFFFNAAVFGFAINVTAGLIGK